MFGHDVAVNRVQQDFLSVEALYGDSEFQKFFPLRIGLDAEAAATKWGSLTSVDEHNRLLDALIDNMWI